MTKTATERIVANLRDSQNRRADYEAYVTENSVTRETMAEHCKVLANLAFPKDAGVQKTDGKRTKYGNAVQLAGFHFRSILAAETTDNEKPVNFLTADGVKDFSDKSEDEIVAAVMAEIERRNA